MCGCCVLNVGNSLVNKTDQVFIHLFPFPNRERKKHNIRQKKGLCGKRIACEHKMIRLDLGGKKEVLGADDIQVEIKNQS